MNYILAYLTAAIVLIIYFAGCSELETNIPQSPDITIHGEGVLSENHPNFHGNFLIDENMDLENCQQCHASDFQGGITDVSCINCHKAIAVHQDDIISPESQNFHGKLMAENNWELNQCQQCHKVNFAGSTASPTCLNCHQLLDVHVEGIINPSSENFHGKFIAAHNWDLIQCRQCHSTDYSGGLVSSSCLTCHTQENGPEACNTCHGEFAGDRIAPPGDLNGNTTTTFPGVGAHVKHLYEYEIGNRVRCSSCHDFPDSVYAAGHVDTELPAEILFGNISNINAASNASYNYSDNTCANTYCHGNFEFYRDSTEERNKFVYTADKMTGNNKTVKWTVVNGNEAECGSCHGLPPEGHIQYSLNTCVSCHPGVVDANGNIIDRTKHIDGVTNIWGE